MSTLDPMNALGQPDAPPAARWRRRALVPILGLLGVIAAITLVLSSLYPLEYMRRVFVLGEADVFDYRDFDRRRIRRADQPFELVAAPDPARIEALAHGVGIAESLPMFLATTGTQAFIVIRDDRVLYERYFNGHARDAVVTSFSIAKPILASLIGIAIGEGLIGSVDDPITRYLPELSARDPRFGQITLRHLLTMSSGLRYAAFPFLNGDDFKTYYWPDLADLALRHTQIVAPPATRFQINNYDPLLLGLALQRATGRSASAWAEERLWQRIGTEFNASWSLDHPGGLEKLESGFNARAIDFARLGRLWLRGGDWGGEQVLPAGWMAEATARPAYAHSRAFYADTPFLAEDPGRHFGFMFWAIPRAGAPHDFVARGDHGQFVYVSPGRKVVIVRHGTEYGVPPAQWIQLMHAIASGP